jgi:hypothetical protein
MPKNTGRIIGISQDYCEAHCLSARKAGAVLWSSNLVNVPHHILAADAKYQIICSLEQKAGSTICARITDDLGSVDAGGKLFTH